MSNQSGDTAVFAASSVVTASTNAAYTGTVYVFATYLDPTSTNLYNYMPGDLRGIGTNGLETALQSFGLADVELRDGSGNLLQIASGQTATLTYAIPDTLQAAAPATVPLWYFNDSSGRWIQQGSATRVGNSYVGKVSHFTWWTCAAPVSTVNFTVHLKDQYGNPLAYTYYLFKSQNMGTRGGYTDSAGFAQGLIPKGVELALLAVSQCGSQLGGVNMGPAQSDQSLGTVTITTTGGLLTFTGTVVDCSSNPVDSGFVSTSVDGLNYRAAVKNGSFTLPIDRCFLNSSTVSLTAKDLNTQLQGSATTVTVTIGTIPVGQLSTCP